MARPGSQILATTKKQISSHTKARQHALLHMHSVEQQRVHGYAGKPCCTIALDIGCVDHTNKPPKPTYHTHNYIKLFPVRRSVFAPTISPNKFEQPKIHQEKPPLPTNSVQPVWKTASTDIFLRQNSLSVDRSKGASWCHAFCSMLGTIPAHQQSTPASTIYFQQSSGSSQVLWENPAIHSNTDPLFTTFLHAPSCSSRPWVACLNPKPPGSCQDPSRPVGS